MSIFKNRTVIGVICILLALVICFGITPLFNQSAFCGAQRPLVRWSSGRCAV